MASVLDSETWILGPEVTAFESEFAEYLGAQAVIGVGNGTDALAIALISLGLEPGSRVLMAETEGGYAATACRLAGFIPIALDVDPVSFDLTADIARHADLAGVGAIVITHLHGNAVQMASIVEWATKAGIAVVEDCAQAAGLRVAGAHVGLAGAVAAFSFYPTKNLGGVGDAGAVVFAQAGENADRARALRQYGWDDERVPTLPGGRNSRLDPLQAAVLRARLPFLDARNARRVAIRERYAEAAPGLLLGAGSSTVAHHAVVRLRSQAERDELADRFDVAGVDTAVHYRTLDSEMTGLSVAAPRGSEVAAMRREVILSLPCSPELTDTEVNRVAAVLERWAAEHD